MVTNGRAFALILVAVVGLLTPAALPAQVAARTTPEPLVTAERADWYLAGEPITWAGNIYYPAGAQVFFNRYEMIRSGFYEGVPLYVRTTLEPFSTVFVPVGGGLMQPYERRRAGDVAGTSGSLTSSFPVVTPAEEDPYEFPGLLEAPGPPTRTAMSLGSTARDYPGVAPGYAPPPAPTTGREPEPLPAPVGPLQSALLPQGLNGVYIEYDSRRWFSDGPAVELSSAGFTRVGEYHGFPVYKEPGKDATIYVAAKSGGDATLTPYSLRH